MIEQASSLTRRLQSDLEQIVGRETTPSMYEQPRRLATRTLVAKATRGTGKCLQFPDRRGRFRMQRNYPFSGSLARRHTQARRSVEIDRAG